MFKENWVILDFLKNNTQRNVCFASILFFREAPNGRCCRTHVCVMQHVEARTTHSKKPMVAVYDFFLQPPVRVIISSEGEQLLLQPSQPFFEL